MCKKAKFNTPEGKAFCESRYGKCETCKRLGNDKFCSLCEKKSNYLFNWRGYAEKNNLFPYSVAC